MSFQLSNNPNTGIPLIEGYWENSIFKVNAGNIHFESLPTTQQSDIKKLWKTPKGYIGQGPVIDSEIYCVGGEIVGSDIVVTKNDGSNFGTRVGGAGAELFAYIDVPLGYTATKVKITGSDTANEVEVYTLDLDDGTIGSEISNSALTVADDTDLASNHVGADDKMLLIKVVTTATDDIVYGGYVTIEAT